MIGQPEKIGRYKILECVGRGGMGVLYRAHDPMLERDVAIKLMLVDFTGDDTARQRFHREAKAIARLQHRNVVTIHELGEEENTPFIVMEFLSGRDLEKIMKAKVALSLDEKLDIVIQLCAGLAFAHEHGIVHRDIKPGNVRVLEDGTVKILDFGIAKLAMGGTTQVGMVMGSANYMAPEQAADEAVDGRADLFSTGVLLYELLGGRKPFIGESPTATLYQIVHHDPPPLRTIVSSLPPELDDIVMRALKKNPDDRYSRASELAADLQIIRAVIQTPSATGMPVLDETQIVPSLSPPAAERTYPSSAGRLSHATLRPPVMRAPAVDVRIPPPDAAPSGSTTIIRAGRRTTIMMVAGAVAVAAIVVAVLLIRNRADGTTATVSPTTTIAPVTTTSASSVSEVPPVGPAKVTIDSVPAGAKILLDGQDTGLTTPAAVAIDGALPKQVQLGLKGYQPLVARLDKADVAAGSQTFTLVREAAPIRVSVSASYPFQIVQGSRTISAAKTSHDVVVQPGQGGFRATNSEVFLNENLDDDLRRGRAIELPDLGTVNVFSSVERGCSISIDGRNVGDPPIQNQSMVAGVHNFSIRCEDGRADTQRKPIAPGDRTRVTLNPRD